LENSSRSIRAIFSGLVQGVGFRFTAVSLARKYNLKGWVKNLSDGRVELVAEGLDKDLNCFFKDLNKEFERSLIDCQVQDIESQGNFRGFQILV